MSHEQYSNTEGRIFQFHASVSDYICLQANKQHLLEDVCNSGSGLPPLYRQWHWY